MKYAIDRFVNNREGQEMEVSAADIYEQCHGGKPLRADTRFYCPECHERVFWHCRGGRLPDFFSHHAKTESSPECDKRVDGRSDLYIYERTGLPLYLSLKYGDVYSLNIAFPAIGEHLLRIASENNVVIRINDSMDVRVTQSRFFSDETTLIPVAFLPPYEKNYRIAISAPTSLTGLRKKWSDYADGFASGGAIFNIQSSGGKKIKRGDSITIGKEYYAVAKDLIPRTWYSKPLYPEIKHRVVGKIALNNTTYNVYVFSVDVSADSSRFETLNTFFYNHFKVWLVEQTATIVPIWPPIIERGDWISFSSKGQVYCSVESGNDSPKVFTYTGSNALDVPVRTDASGNNSVKFNIYSNDPTMVSVDRKYTGREVGIRKGSMPVAPIGHTVKLFADETEIIRDESIDYESISGDITVKSNTKFTLLQKSKKHIYRTIVIDQPSVSIDIPNDTDELIMAYGRMGVGFVPFESVHITHPQKITAFDETLIIAQIQSHAKGDMILAPMWIREVISFCSQNQYYKVQQAITASICNGRIRKGLVMYLNQFRRTFING